MRIFCDSSTREACYVVEGLCRVVFPYEYKVTVNEGEYLAVIAALEDATQRKRTSILLFTDSQLVVNQISGKWQCNYEHLRILRDRVRLLVRDQDVTIAWIPREENLAGRILDD